MGLEIDSKLASFLKGVICANSELHHDAGTIARSQA